jgi:hypothetical protein
VFNASTAIEWKSQMLQQDPPNLKLDYCLHTNLPQHPNPTVQELRCRTSSFTAYFVLQSIHAQISEGKMRNDLSYNSPNFNQLLSALLCWHSTFHNYITQTKDPLDLKILWHAGCMSLFTNFNKLERALGRNGSRTPSSKEDISYAISWATSISADRCVLHAHIIQQSLSEMRLNKDPAIHIPHCAFLAGIACYTTMRFRRDKFKTLYPSCYTPSTPHSPLEFPELIIDGQFSAEHLASSAYILFKGPAGEQLQRTITEPRQVVQVGADIFRGCIDVLQRMGHCGNARAYGKTLWVAIESEIELWMVG